MSFNSDFSVVCIFPCLSFLTHLVTYQHRFLDAHSVGSNAILLLIILLMLWPKFDLEELFHTKLYLFNILHFIWTLSFLWHDKIFLDPCFKILCVCVWYACKCVCVSMCVGICVCTWVFGGLRSRLNVFLCLFPPYILRAGYLTKPELKILGTLLDACSGDSLSYLVSSEVGL